VSFKAYLDTVKAKTGKTPDDFRILAQEKGLVKRGEIVAWLKAEFELGHGHANAVAAVLTESELRSAGADEKIAALFDGKKAVWRPVYDDLASQISAFGADVALSPNLTYINVLRGSAKFAIIQASSAEHLDLGIKLKGVEPAGRLAAAGSWNSMVTHRVRISDPAQIDAELVDWLRQAYAAAARSSGRKP
jgi:hypothetical protein